jgi:hypothetical protein
MIRVDYEANKQTFKNSKEVESSHTVVLFLNLKKQL